MSKPEWESVGANLYRFPVPGGWLYRRAYRDEMVFVPNPPLMTVEPQYGIPFTVT